MFLAVATKDAVGSDATVCGHEDRLSVRHVNEVELDRRLTAAGAEADPVPQRTRARIETRDLPRETQRAVRPVNDDSAVFTNRAKMPLARS